MDPHRPRTADLSALDLKARIAELETTNKHLATKVAELAFYSSAAARLGASIDRHELVRIVLDCIGVALEDRHRPRFLIVRSGNALAFAGGASIASETAQGLIDEYRDVLERRLRVDDVAHVGPLLVIGLPGVRREPPLGALAVVTEQGHQVGRPGVRRLIRLAALAGGSFANARMLEQSIATGVTDELTGVFNRRYFDRRLAEELKRARRLGDGMSVLLFDLDHFKSINDRFGHPTGDRMLRAVAQCICTSVRDIDVVTRWGGEEFAVIVPGSDGQDAFIAAERVREAVRALRVPLDDGESIGVTLSCGIAWAAADIHTPAQFVASADRCLLEAKQNGRDQTIMMREREPAAHQGRADEVDERTGREHRGAARRS